MATAAPAAPLARRHGRVNVCHLLRSGYASLNFIGIYREPVLGRLARYWSKSGRIKDSPLTISFECVTALWLRVHDIYLYVVVLHIKHVTSQSSEHNDTQLQLLLHIDTFLQILQDVYTGKFQAMARKDGRVSDL